MSHNDWNSSPKTLKYSMLVASDIMPTAYILVNCTLGSEEKIINEIAKLPDVKEVRGTYGVHDIFVKVKSDNTETMNHTITNKIRKVSGITSTVTLVVIEEQGGKGNT
jgi:DNA-binding Lrp family transcriptional regulator